MKQNNRLFIFILINIIVSALTTLGVIFLWERTHPRPEMNAANPSEILNETEHDQVKISSDQNDQDPEPELTLVEEDLSIIIYAVVGAGNLDVEYVEIRNLSSGPVDPAGWQLIDEDGHTFTFPSSPSWVLNSGGAVKVLSKSGNNSVIELFWQSDAPVWQSGEQASLLDADGDVIATYSIP